MHEIKPGTLVRVKPLRFGFGPGAIIKRGFDGIVCRGTLEHETLGTVYAIRNVSDANGPITLRARNGFIVHWSTVPLDK